MATVIRFPRRRRHVGVPAASRDAKRIIRSEVMPADLAFSVDKIRSHHSEGILSRFHHLITAQLPAPTSAAIASREPQRSMIERNESKSGMSDSMGLFVPKIKAIMSHDYVEVSGHYVPMAQDDDEIAESAWREAFRARLKHIRGKRTQEDMADLLCISRDTYSKYEGARASAVPTRLLPKIAKIGAVTLEWLIEGEKSIKAEQPAKPAKPLKRKTG